MNIYISKLSNFIQLLVWLIRE